VSECGTQNRKTKERKMPLSDEVEIRKRTMILFFIVDTSESKIGIVNPGMGTAIGEVLPMIKHLSDQDADMEIKIAMLEFSCGARWITGDEPQEPSQFHWNGLEAKGCTDFGEACRALNEKLSFKAYMKNEPLLPLIILLSGSEPTDIWRPEFAKLKQNNWFKYAMKVAVAIGMDINRDILKEFTGHMEAVLYAFNAENLTKMIKFVIEDYLKAVICDRRTFVFSGYYCDDVCPPLDNNKDSW
jgi:uncharacterized protein YegL